MKFYDYLHLYQYDSKRFGGDLKAQNIKNLNEYIDILKRSYNHTHKRTDKDFGYSNDDAVRLLLGLAESEWIENGKPYYDIYPSVIKLLKGIKLDFEYSNLSMPIEFPSLMLRFPENEVIRNIFFKLNLNNGVYKLLMNILFRDENPITKSMECDRATATMSWKIDTTLDEVVDVLISNSCSNNVQDSLIREVFTICIAICMIGDDPEFLDAQVLNKDVDKVNDENRQFYIEKAKSNGKFGFSFGKRIEVCPHIRRNHMCMVPYGPNRSLRKYKLRKGSIIHRRKIETVPTGLLKDE